MAPDFPGYYGKNFKSSILRVRHALAAATGLLNALSVSQEQEKHFCNNERGLNPFMFEIKPSGPK